MQPGFAIMPIGSSALDLVYEEAIVTRVHFDLAGFDILFWEPDRLDDFRHELEKRVARRRELLS